MPNIVNESFFVTIVLFLFLGVTLVRLDVHKSQPYFTYMLFVFAIDLMVYHITQSVVIFLSVLSASVVLVSLIMVLKTCKKKRIKNAISVT